MSIASQSSFTSDDFYVVGGTLRRDAPSYVPRRADDDLYHALASGAVCYVLTSRQMGKSSLMVRTAARLRAAGDAAVVLDLTEIGQNLTAEQWYKGLLGSVAEQLDLEDELGDVWRERRDLGPMQRWTRAMIDVVLPRVPGRVVIFVDEIDAVRSLPFSTDEFFAGIRELYNRRTETPELARLTFCLLGVASPSDLTRDTRTTPFNVGRRVELSDFTREEAEPLARGLGRDATSGRDLLDRILAWTGGHPYLTQRLCRAVAEDSDVCGPGDVNRICDDLFLSRRARELDDNLLFVRDRMLRGEADLAELLELFRRVRSGHVVADDDASPLVGVLKLSGVARVHDGRLRVRNRIYEHAFDDAWIRESMPGAEVRRQRRAFASGFVRAAGVSLVVLAIMAGLVSYAWHSQARAEEQRRIAEAERATNRRLVYVAHMNLAYQAYERGDFVRAAQLVDDEASTDARGFEYFYLWRLIHGETHTYSTDSVVVDVEYSPDGSRIAAGTRSSIVLWDAASGAEVLRIHNGHDGGGFGLTFSPDGAMLSVASSDGGLRAYDAHTGALLREMSIDRTAVTMMAVAPGAPAGSPALASGDALGHVRLYDSVTGKEVASIDTGDGGINAGVFSGDGKLLATGSMHGRVSVWEVATGRRVSTLSDDGQTVWTLAFSPIDRSVAVAKADGSVALLDVDTAREVAKLRHPGGMVGVVRFSRDGRRIGLGLPGRVEVRDLDGRVLASHTGHRDQILDVDFSPDGSSVVSGGVDQTVRTWDSSTSATASEVVARHDESVYALAYSTDGTRVATASFDGTAAVWDSSWHRLATLRGHTDRVHSVAFSPDGSLVATGSADRTARVWDAATGALLATIDGFDERVFSVAFSPDGSRLAVGCFDGTVRFWDVATRASVRTIRVEPAGSVECVAFSPDGSLVAAGGESKTVELIDATTGESRGVLRGHEDWVDSLAFSPDGTKLATAGSYGDMTVVVWDVATRTPIYRLKGFSGNSGFSPASMMGSTGRANCVRFSPDGLTLVTGTTDRTVKLFDVRTGQELCTIATPHETQVYAVAFSPDSGTLLTASEDHTVRAWRSAPRDDVASRAR